MFFIWMTSPWGLLSLRWEGKLGDVARPTNLCDEGDLKFLKSTSKTRSRNNFQVKKSAEVLLCFMFLLAI
jgi:hypothetical protein